MLVRQRERHVGRTGIGVRSAKRATPIAERRLDAGARAIRDMVHKAGTIARAGVSIRSASNRIHLSRGVDIRVVGI